MATKSYRKGTKKDGGEWRDKLRNVEFSYEEEEEVKAWFSTQTQPWYTYVEDVVNSGYSFKITPPNKTDDWWCSSTCKDVGNSWYDYTFTVKYPDFESVIMIMYYFLTVHLIEGRYVVDDKGGSRDWLK